MWAEVTSYVEALMADAYPGHSLQVLTLIIWLFFNMEGDWEGEGGANLVNLELWIIKEIVKHGDLISITRRV